MARRTTGRSRRVPLWVAALFLLASLAALPVIVVADGLPSGSGDPNYTVYGACARDSAPPAHLCHKGDSIAAFFRSAAKDAVYDVCVEKPSFRLCAYAQPASAGVLYMNSLSGITGPMVMRWRVNGGEIGTWQMDVYPDPVVSKFGVNPLIVSRTHQLFGLVLRHVAAGSRVRAWRKCPHLCPLRLRLTSVRGETRRYEMTGSPAGASFALGETLYVQVDAPGKSEHGYRVWGRLYKGELVRNPHGGPRDTAIERVGDLLCTPPDTNFRRATYCAEVGRRASDYPAR